MRAAPVRDENVFRILGAPVQIPVITDEHLSSLLVLWKVRTSGGSDPNVRIQLNVPRKVHACVSGIGLETPRAAIEILVAPRRQARQRRREDPASLRNSYPAL